MIEPITAKQALEALENMDDYARMAGITPTGPYETLFTYIKRSNYTIEMLRAHLEQKILWLMSKKQCLKFLET